MEQGLVVTFLGDQRRSIHGCEQGLVCECCVWAAIERKAERDALKATLKGRNSFAAGSSGKKKKRLHDCWRRQEQQISWIRLVSLISLSCLFSLRKVAMMLLNRGRKARACGNWVTFIEKRCDGSCFLGCLLSWWLCYILIGYKTIRVKQMSEPREQIHPFLHECLLSGAH